MTPLRGILLRDENADLIIRATPEDVRAFAGERGAEVVVTHGSVRASLDAAYAMTETAEHPTYVQPGEYLYSADGLRVAVVTEVFMEREQLDVTTFVSAFRVHAPGLLRINYRALGVRP